MEEPSPHAAKQELDVGRRKRFPSRGRRDGTSESVGYVILSRSQRVEEPSPHAAKQEFDVGRRKRFPSRGRRDGTSESVGYVILSRSQRVEEPSGLGSPSKALAKTSFESCECSHNGRLPRGLLTVYSQFA